MPDKTKSPTKYKELVERIVRLEAQIRARQASDDQAPERELEKRIAALESVMGGQGAHDDGGSSGARGLRHCAVPAVAPRTFAPDVSSDRARLIRFAGRKWLNGTKLRYAFMAESSNIGGPVQKSLVRQGFARWKDVGIGISFEEVPSIDGADIRIGFVEGDGAWSYIGRDVRDIPGRWERTMNFGWDLTEDPREVDVAVHEIGHTLGFPHEHQNPFAGIVWNEPEVLRVFSGSPNNWSEAEIRHNILNKLPASEVQGTQWDPDSVMHYAFEAGLILQPQQFRNGLKPAGSLSPRDIAQARVFYPPHDDSSNPELRPLRSQVLSLAAAEQANFNIAPTASRNYKFQTFGGADTVLVLFEDRGSGDLHYVKGDDDSGVERNATIEAKLDAGRKYVLRVRMFANSDGKELAVMMS